MKLIGILLVLGGCIGMGLYESYYVNARYQHGLAWKKALICLRGEVEYARTPLPEAFQVVGQKNAGKVGKFFVSLSEKLFEADTGQMDEFWQECLDKTFEKKDLLSEDRGIVNDMGKTLGYLDVTMQVNTINLYLERLQQSLALQEREKKEKIRLYNLLGVSGGVFIALMIC